MTYWMNDFWEISVEIPILYLHELLGLTHYLSYLYSLDIIEELGSLAAS